MHKIITKELIEKAKKLGACKTGINEAESLLGKPVWKLRLGYVIWAVDNRLVDKSMIIKVIENRTWRGDFGDGYFQYIKYMTEYGYALNWAVKNGHTKMVEYLETKIDF